MQRTPKGRDGNPDARMRSLESQRLPTDARVVVVRRDIGGDTAFERLIAETGA